MRWSPRKRGQKRPRWRRRKPRPRVPVRDRARKGLSLLPSMLTLSNMVCGFYAIVHVGAVVWKGGEPVPSNSFMLAAAAILIAMIFDMLDGRVARMTNSTSDFGAQLDSLADAITFGVAPGVMVAMLHAMGRYGGAAPFWSKMAWVFGMAYACAAVIRLARFNVETESHDEEAHLYFKGLPSPAAAGVIATLILLHHHLGQGPLATALLNAMPFVALVTGYLMVSRFKYVHFANKYLKGRKPAEYLTGILFGAVLAFLFPEITAALIFCGFAFSGPVVGLKEWLTSGGEDEHTVEGAAIEQQATASDIEEIHPAELAASAVDEVEVDEAEVDAEARP
mgnify:CR=1 FL=1